MTWMELTTRYSQEEILRLVKIGLVYDKANKRYRQRVKEALKLYREQNPNKSVKDPEPLIVIAKG